MTANGAGANRIEHTRWRQSFPGLPRHVKDARDWVESRLRGICPEGALDKVLLCVSELATNAVRHSWSGYTRDDDGGFSGEFQVGILPPQGVSVHIAVYDMGPFDGGAEPGTDAGADGFADRGGRGQPIVEALTDWFRYQEQPYGAVARFTYSWKPPDPS